MGALEDYEKCAEMKVDWGQKAPPFYRWQPGWTPRTMDGEKPFFMGTLEKQVLLIGLQ